MKQQLFLCCILSLCCLFISSAQSSADEVKDTFLRFLKTKGYATAFDSLVATNPKILTGSPFQKTIEVFAETAKNGGSYLSCEELSKKEFGTSIVLYSLLCKYENIPLLISLTVYNPSGTWKVISIENEKINFPELNKATNLRAQNNRQGQNMRMQQGTPMQQGGVRTQQGSRMNQNTQQQNAK